MRMQMVAINKLSPAEYNPRRDLKPGDPDYEKLKTSINTFGYVEPLVWNSRTGNLVGGHQRLKILIEQGVQEVEVSVVDLEVGQEKVLNLALNRVQGGWDNEKLAILLKDLSEMPNFDVSLTGFDAPEISSLFDRYLDEGGEAEADVALPEIPVTKPGDLIILGQHRILCGDSSKEEDLAKLLDGKKADLIFTDPPYNVDYSGADRPKPEGQQANTGEEWAKIKNDNLPQAEYEAWLKKIFANMSVYIGKGAAFYIWNGHRQFGPMHQMLINLGFHISCVITWAKERFALGYGDYNQQTEFCLYGWKEDNGAHKWYGEVGQSTLWQIDRESSQTYKHPTQKPVLLAERAIKNSSQREDLVLDLFLGSGTTLITSQKLGRCCYGMELDPGYCDVIVRRYINLVGEENVTDEIKNRYVQAVTHE